MKRFLTMIALLSISLVATGATNRVLDGVTILNQGVIITLPTTASTLATETLDNLSGVAITVPLRSALGSDFDIATNDEATADANPTDSVSILTGDKSNASSTGATGGYSSRRGSVYHC